MNIFYFRNLNLSIIIYNLWNNIIFKKIFFWNFWLSKLKFRFWCNIPLKMQISKINISYSVRRKRQWNPSKIKNYDFYDSICLFIFFRSWLLISLNNWTDYPKNYISWNVQKIVIWQSYKDLLSPSANYFSFLQIIECCQKR